MKRLMKSLLEIFRFIEARRNKRAKSTRDSQRKPQKSGVDSAPFHKSFSSHLIAAVAFENHLRRFFFGVQRSASPTHLIPSIIR